MSELHRLVEREIPCSLTDARRSERLVGRRGLPTSKQVGFEARDCVAERGRNDNIRPSDRRDRS